MPFAANIAVEQEVIVAAIMVAFFFIYTHLLMYTNTRSIKAEYRLCFKTMTPKVGLQNLRAYKT